MTSALVSIQQQVCVQQREEAAPARTRSAATFSPCRRYRYVLWRDWSDPAGPAASYALFVGLNPSTADACNDDPTVRRCMSFARSWGYGALYVANLFAYRATHPRDLLAQQDPVGEHNDAHLRALAGDAAIVVAAWGVHGTHRDRAAQVGAVLPDLHYLRLTRDGHPGHPLYLPAGLRPLRLKARNAPAGSRHVGSVSS